MCIWLRDCMVLAHDEIHVVNVVNEDKTCGLQVC